MQMKLNYQIGKELNEWYWLIVKRIWTKGHPRWVYVEREILWEHVFKALKSSCFDSEILLLLIESAKSVCHVYKGIYFIVNK